MSGSVIASSSLSATRRSAGFLLVLALAYAGGVIAYLPLLSLLLPAKVALVAGQARLGVLTAATLAGAVAASVANIGFGALSDRSLAAGGGRRRLLAVGLAATFASYAAIAAAASPLAIVLAVVLFQIAVNALLAPLLAIMADEVPDAQKGTAGAFLSLGAPAASAVAALLVDAGPPGEGVQFTIMPLVSAACLLPLLLGRAIPAVAAPAVLAQVAPRDLLTAWGARLVVQIAAAVLSAYLLFYADSIVPSAPRAVMTSRVGHLLLVAYLLASPVALAVGRLVDRTGASRPFLVAAAALASLGLLGLATAGSWTTAAAAFTLYTIGSSVFLAVHAGSTMRLLPDPAHRGRDLGLYNLANTMPALVGPLLAWSLATPRDFAPVMLVLALLTLAGGAAMLRVRGRD